MNFISSRTPEGVPGRCPVCGNDVSVTPADGFADAPCPACGVLLWPLPLHDGPAVMFGADLIDQPLRRKFADFAAARAAGTADSLDTVEFVMDVEDALNLTIPDDVAEKLQSVDDLLAWLRERHNRDAA